MSDLFVKVSGVTYEGRQGYLAKMRGDEPVRIVPEPENQYDANALAVHVAMADGVVHVGYVPRDLASKIAPKLDGEAIMVEIWALTGGFDLADGGVANRGLELRVALPDVPDDAPF